MNDEVLEILRKNGINGVFIDMSRPDFYGVTLYGESGDNVGAAGPSFGGVMVGIMANADPDGIDAVEMALIEAGK